MSKPKSYTGEYKLKLDPSDAQFAIATVIVKENAESIELSPNGIRTQTTSNERLLLTKLAAIVSARSASDWRALRFDYVAELEDGKRIIGKSTIDGHFLHTRLNEQRYRQTLRTLLALDSNCLLFLMRASEIQGNQNELSILNALFALELELSRTVPQFLNIGPKLTALEFAEVLSPEALKRLRDLNQLRNNLAHGDWSRENLGKCLVRLLGGGPENWLMHGTARIGTEATHRVLDNIVTALGDLFQCNETLTRLHEELTKLKAGTIASNVPQFDDKTGVP